MILNYLHLLLRPHCLCGEKEGERGRERGREREISALYSTTGKSWLKVRAFCYPDNEYHFEGRNDGVIKIAIKTNREKDDMSYEGFNRVSCHVGVAVIVE